LLEDLRELGEARGMIDGVTNADAIPVLERMVQFAGARHRLIVHNIANLDTPDFRPADVSIEGFRSQMAAAIDDRRSRHGAAGGPLEIESTRETEFTPGGVVLHPEPIGDNILFHDGNDRDPERLTQALVENFMAFRMAADLLRSRFDLINTAIRERV
jgi:flagellar basal-body rod protein FlgB